MAATPPGLLSMSPSWMRPAGASAECRCDERECRRWSTVGAAVAQDAGPGLEGALPTVYGTVADPAELRLSLLENVILFCVSPVAPEGLAWMSKAFMIMRIPHARSYPYKDCNTYCA
ncbi:hypothetical protein GCM10011588_37740 [Nocardia jinanensis]|uniref:Uncharacterized protein n=1 Tax=Nocardia jinanensis TaxID=382504 RepID=A0A917VVU4_9NOCA|nr:hypothetical protein GCM10011588_37740 [Nocardia jinanensis]